MAEPSTTIVTITSAGAMSILGIATGLDLPVMAAGLFGALWSQAYSPPTSVQKRAFLTLLASVLAGYLAPASASAVMTLGVVREAFTVATLQLPTAVLIGLLAHRVLGPAVMKLAAKKAEDLTK